MFSRLDQVVFVGGLTSLIYITRLPIAFIVHN